MIVEMRFWMETEDDDEPMTEEQWKKELESIVGDVSKHINKNHATYVKNADGEFATENMGTFNYVPNKDD